MNQNKDEVAIRTQKFTVTREKFFSLWLVLMKGFINLRTIEELVLSKLLEHRSNYSKMLTNKDDISLLLFSTNTRRTIMKELDIKEADFNNTLSRLRKLKVIENNDINGNLIPTVKADFNNFKLIFDVTIKG